MLIFKEKQSLDSHLKNLKAAQKSIGFVPTMGALHEGHLSLIQCSKQENDYTICSIFVNPAQFDDANDLKNYPRPIEKDLQLLTGSGCDILFLPSPEEMYAHEEMPALGFQLGGLDHILEGAFRRGHFQGVALVVDKFLALVQPDRLYLGQKDFQQCLIIKELVRQNHPAVEVAVAPTLREADGLAMSSRNVHLTETQRANAALIYQCLVSIQTKKNLQSFSIVKKECHDLLVRKGVVPDYIELADADNLEILTEYPSGRPAVALIAVRIGEIRLIDNLVFS